MTLRRFLAAFLASAALVVSPLAFAVDESATVALGRGTVLLPVLPGFADPATTPPALLDLMSRSMPATNRFVAILPTQDFLDRRAAGENVAMSRYMLVQTVRAHEQNGVSQAEFERIKAMLRQQSDTMLHDSEKQVQESFDSVAKELGKTNDDSSLTLKAGAGKSLGVFDETPNSISMANIQSLTRSDKAGTHTLVQAVAMSIALVGDVPLSVCVYSTYQSPADIDWTKREVLDWVKRYTVLNADAGTK